MVAGCVHPDARIRLTNVGVNPTRAGVIGVLEAMGARVRLENVREGDWEPIADVVAETSALEAVEIGGDVVPTVIDELPVLALAACMAEGTTVVRDAEELRVKESDRISRYRRGAVRARREHRGAPGRHDNPRHRRPEGRVRVEPRRPPDSDDARDRGPGREAGETVVEGADAAAISYPDFWDTLGSVAGAE